MKYLFIGGNSDGDVIEVEPRMSAFRVADKTVHSLSLNGPSKEARGVTLYTKRKLREWSEEGFFEQTFFYFADQSLTDEQALARYLECTK